MKKIKTAVKRYYPFGLILMALLGFFEWSVSAGITPHFIIPKPSSVVLTLIEQYELLWRHTLITLLEVAVGLGVSIGLGIPLGILLHYSSWAKRALYPFVLVSQTIPIIALSPIFVMWFGYGLTIKVAVIFLFCFFPLVVSTYDGLKVTDPAYLSLFRNLKASKWQMFKYLQWRMALPSVLSGIKLSVIYALMGATVGEWLGGSDGLGYYIRRTASNLKADGVFAGIVILSLIGLILFGVVSGLEAVLLHYRNQERNA